MSIPMSMSIPTDEYTDEYTDAYTDEYERQVHVCARHLVDGEVVEHLLERRAHHQRARERLPQLSQRRADELQQRVEALHLIKCECE